MKKIILSSAFALATVVLFSFNNPTSTKQVETYTVTAQKSKVDFTGSKKNDFHTGTIPVKSGSVKIEAGKLVGGSFVVDVAAMKVTDAAGDKLLGHLTTADFFDVAKFGEATYTISSVDYSSATACTINGSLNIKGVPVPVSFAANIRSASEKGLFGQAYFSIDRTLLGIAYAGPSKDVQIAVHLFAK